VSVDFTKLELNKLSPIYSQMVRFIKMEIVSGNIANGDEMPSRRIVSTMLGVNPNTVQKAYKQLEVEELLISYAGSKSIVSFNENQGIKIKEELIFHETMNYIEAVKSMGITLTQTKNIIGELWEQGIKGDEMDE
jgi:GntR family transcriptional regulator